MKVPREMGWARTPFRGRQGHLELGKSKASGKSILSIGLFQNVWGLSVRSKTTPDGFLRLPIQEAVR